MMLCLGGPGVSVVILKGSEGEVSSSVEKCSTHHSVENILMIFIEGI